jgi:putative ABC transport system permease protein
MSAKQYFSIALSALLANKMRSGLTMLGVIIGVAAVVSLVSIGEGAQNAITAQIEGAGANIIVIVPSTDLQPGAGSSTNSLTLNDSLTIEDEINGVQSVSAEYRNSATVTFEDESESIPIYGTDPQQAVVRNLSTDLGRFLVDEDEEDAARVAVLGSTTADSLFGGLDPIGRDIRINGVRFEVVGVTAPTGGGSPLSDPNDRVYVPISTAYRKLFGTSGASVPDPVSGITIAVTDTDMIAQIIEETELLIRDLHNISPDDPVDFTIINQSELLSAVSEVSVILTIFLGAIASVSLLVGGIGIMNISLVSVTERTSEIGLRKAVGAKNPNILYQFLIETIVLSTTGGLLGIVVSGIIVFLINQTGFLLATLSPTAVLLGVGFSILVGVFFGIYPANRASQLQPIEALRYE